MTIQSPNKLPNNDFKTVFLAGSMGDTWRSKLITELNIDNVNFLDPTRNDWDSSWKEVVEDKNFRKQVIWELDGMETADLIVVNFESDAKAPISLLEFGLFCKDKDMLVLCQNGYHKKGNVDIVCERYGVTVYNNYDAWKQAILDYLLS